MSSATRAEHLRLLAPFGRSAVEAQILDALLNSPAVEDVFIDAETLADLLE